jgi:hypothetical protein
MRKNVHVFYALGSDDCAPHAWLNEPGEICMCFGEVWVTMTSDHALKLSADLADAAKTAQERRANEKPPRAQYEEDKVGGCVEPVHPDDAARVF